MSEKNCQGRSREVEGVRVDEVVPTAADPPIEIQIEEVEKAEGEVVQVLAKNAAEADSSARSNLPSQRKFKWR